MTDNNSAILRSRFVIVFMPNIIFFVTLVIMILLTFRLGFAWQFFSGASVVLAWRFIELLIGQILMIVGIIFVVWGVTSLGISRAQGKEIGFTRGRSTLVHTGAYAFCRHPTTLGFILAIPGFALTFDFIPLLLASLIYIPLLLALLGYEELELLRRFGDKYTQYRQTVPFIIPRGKRVLSD